MTKHDKSCACSICENAARESGTAALHSKIERLQAIATAAYNVFVQREAGVCAEARQIGWEELEVALSAGYHAATWIEIERARADLINGMIVEGEIVKVQEDLYDYGDIQDRDRCSLLVEPLLRFKGQRVRITVDVIDMKK